MKLGMDDKEGKGLGKRGERLGKVTVGWGKIDRFKDGWKV